MNQILMAKGAKQVVEVCAQVKENEKVVIITEPKTMSIAESVAAAVVAVGAEPVISIIMPRTSDSAEPPETVAAAMLESDVFISAVFTSITHTYAVKNAVQNGSRGIMLTQFEEHMLIDSGVMADFPKAAPTCEAVAKALENAEVIHLKTSHGTDLTMSATGRKSNAMTGMVKAGQFAPVPTIEANVSPLEGTANGTIVTNASIPYIGIGLVKENVVVTVKDGMITNIEGGYEAQILKDDLASKNDENVYNIAEIGVGLNPRCKFNGLMLEDEGVFGSVHIGIGSSITLGGTVKAACHYDLIMTGVTLVADGVTIIEDGNVLL
ncbi:aminopeptidase [Sporosarcina oncorhynchi]|uniref:Aminopeptidase n=1 Tax=Sporosarcina oncorhynchi TaxID=3056444 RepID=A0ABZ0L6B9_9BACL|nr:aminopeptidase [Sporosarcina sp. T2O-4]WOV88119.1 aminopeptidase [Sporosarcina sp. T2O-4]